MLVIRCDKGLTLEVSSYGIMVSIWTRLDRRARAYMRKNSDIL